MRFSCTKHCASDRPRPISPNKASSDTKTSVKLTRGWSVGILKVHIYSSTFTPALFAGTNRQVMPRASPSLPEVRANRAQWVATCMPVVHIFWPLMIQPLTLSRVAGTALVSICVASVAVEHGNDRQVADDGMLVLQIVVQAKAL